MCGHSRASILLCSYFSKLNHVLLLLVTERLLSSIKQQQACVLTSPLIPKLPHPLSPHQLSSFPWYNRRPVDALSAPDPAAGSYPRRGSCA